MRAVSTHPCSSALQLPRLFFSFVLLWLICEVAFCFQFNVSFHYVSFLYILFNSCLWFLTTLGGRARNPYSSLRPPTLGSRTFSFVIWYPYVVVVLCQVDTSTTFVAFSLDLFLLFGQLRRSLYILLVYRCFYAVKLVPRFSVVLVR